jgi:uncharacterized protein (DUF58 family)
MKRWIEHYLGWKIDLRFFSRKVWKAYLLHICPSLVMLFSDLLADPGPIYHALRRLRHGGHDVILFHILDEAEVRFPFAGMIEFEEPETSAKIQVDADSFRSDYLKELHAFCEQYRKNCFQMGVDYVQLDTSMQFDRALTEYLVSRRARY